MLTNEFSWDTAGTIKEPWHRDWRTVSAGSVNLRPSLSPCPPCPGWPPAPAQHVREDVQGFQLHSHVLLLGDGTGELACDLPAHTGGQARACTEHKVGAVRPRAGLHLWSAFALVVFLSPHPSNPADQGSQGWRGPRFDAESDQTKGDSWGAKEPRADLLAGSPHT